MTDVIRIVIADDHDLYREGLVSFLKKEEPAIVIAGEAANGTQLVKLVKELQPDIVLTDLKMPGLDGVQAIKEITAAGYAGGCIALSSFDSEYLIVEAVEAGAKGYIVKNAQKNEIMEAIHMVYNNCPYYCRTVTAMITQKIVQSGTKPGAQWNKMVVSEREKEIIRLVCCEETSEEIGKKLFMSKKNVDFLRGKIMKKLNVKTMIGLVVYAVKNEIFTGKD